MTRVFISYTRRHERDKAFAENLRQWLLRNGFSPWMDVYNIPKGANWDDEIDKALAAADVVLGVASATSVTSDSVKDEWAYAQEENKLQLAYIQPCDIPPRFIRIDYIDFTGQDPSVWQRLNAVLTTIGQQAGRLPAQAPQRQFQSENRPTAGGIRNWLGGLGNPVFLMAGGALAVGIVLVIILALALNVDGGNNNTGNGDDQVANAENFLAHFWAGQIDPALTYVCPAQRQNVRVLFNDILANLFNQGLDVQAWDITCQASDSDMVRCTYTLVYTNGVSEPVDVRFQTRDGLVCDPAFDF